MLEQLLDLIRKNGTLQPAVLASRLNLSTAMVEAMLDDLKRMGLLQLVDTTCSKPCGSCSMANSCGSQGFNGQLWILSRKGIGRDTGDIYPFR